MSDGRLTEGSPAPIPLRRNTTLIIGAIAVISLGGLAVMALVVAALAPTFSKARGAALRTVTISRVKQIQTSILIYASDHDGRLPIDLSDTRAVRRATEIYAPASQDIWQSSNPAASDFAWNSALSGRDTNKIPNDDDTALLFDSKPWGSSPTEERDGYAVGFVNGGAHMRSQEEFEKGRAAAWVFPPRKDDRARQRGQRYAMTPPATTVQPM